MTRGVDITRGEQSATDTPMGTPPGREAPSRLPERIPVEIRVADTGTGILAANRDKVFDLYLYDRGERDETAYFVR